MTELIPVELGLKLGYEDYRGEIYDSNHNIICSWSYDKRQKKYISKVTSAIFTKGFKRFYADSVKQLVFQISKSLTPNPSQ